MRAVITFFIAIFLASATIIMADSSASKAITMRPCIIWIEHPDISDNGIKFLRKNGYVKWAVEDNEGVMRPGGVIRFHKKKIAVLEITWKPQEREVIHWRFVAGRYSYKGLLPTVLIHDVEYELAPPDHGSNLERFEEEAVLSKFE